MKQLLSALTVLCALLFAASDVRADGSLKDAAPVAEAARCVGGAFSGAYAGIQLGGGSMRSHQETDSNFGGLTFSDNDGGFTIGGYDGYNVQCGRVLFGIESDFNYFHANTESTLDEGPCCSGSGFATFQSDMNWFGTLRGRLGLVRDENLLIFATGGLAYANIDHTFSDTGAPGGPFSQSDSNTQFGWTAGGGIEFMRDSHWSLRADALYVDLGSEAKTYTTDPTLCGGVCTARVNWDDNFWVARVGLAYHFGQREAAVVPMK
jgi:outer membrane immunogenic protein